MHPLFPGLAGTLLESSRDEFPLLVLDRLHLLLDALFVDELDNLAIPQLERQEFSLYSIHRVHLFSVRGDIKVSLQTNGALSQSAISSTWKRMTSNVKHFTQVVPFSMRSANAETGVGVTSRPQGSRPIEF